MNYTINLLVAFSNIVGIFPLLKVFNKNNIFETILIGLMIIASFLMHISETKHNLPGFLFTKHSYKLLWFDRIMAYICSAYIIYKIVYNIHILNQLVFEIFAGLFSLFISEVCVKEPLSFMFFHIIWHFIAYDILYKIL